MNANLTELLEQKIMPFVHNNRRDYVRNSFTNYFLGENIKLKNIDEVYKDYLPAILSVFNADPTGTDRHKQHVYAKRMMIWVLLLEKRFSMSLIARKLGKNHATIIHHRWVMKDHLEVERDWQATTLQFLTECRNMGLPYRHLVEEAELRSPNTFAKWFWKDNIVTDKVHFHLQVA